MWVSLCILALGPVNVRASLYVQMMSHEFREGRDEDGLVGAIKKGFMRIHC